MNEPVQGPTPTNYQPEPLNRWEARRLRREERFAARGHNPGGAWMLGAILVIVGIAILVQNLGGPALDNWWALFILLPAVGCFGTAWSTYQNAGGRLTAASRGSLIAGCMFTMVSAIFLFGLNWTILGPALLILAGISILVNMVIPG